MRKEVPNTFTEGIIADLNPINTPSNALTDCLNGTLITYDDNEWSLQNDKGNYPLRNCRLKPGYVPVGLQEYNGVLYIISHNPEENKTEIGSYPSPGTLIEEDNKENEVDIDIKTGPWDGKYSYEGFCDNNNTWYTFIGSGGQQNWLISPGDQIDVTRPTAPSPIYFQYSLLNKEHTNLDVTEEVNVIANTGLKYVPWKSSGWLAVKPTLPNISDFRVNIRKFKLTSYKKTFEYDFNVQIEFEGNLTNDLGLDCYKGEEPISPTDSTPKDLPLSNGRTVKFFNYRGTVEDFDAAVVFTFKPYIEVLLPGQVGATKYYYISYERKIVADPNNTAKIEDIEIASRKFTYNVDKRASGSSNGSIVFNFSSGNIDEAALLEEELELYYSISRYVSSAWSPVTIGEKHLNKFNDPNIYGENSLQIDTVPYTQINDGLTTSLFSEDVYRIQLLITTPLSSADSTSLETAASSAAGIQENSAYKVVTIYSVVTELMNNNTSPRYDQVPISEWIEKYPKTIKDEGNKLTFTASSTPEVTSVTGDGVYKFWSVGNNIQNGTNTYTRLFDVSYSDYLSQGFNIHVEASAEGTLTALSNLSILSGPFWKDTIDNITITIGDEQTNFNSYTGIINMPSPETITMISEQEIKYKLKQEGRSSLWNYSIETPVPYGISDVMPKLYWGNGGYVNKEDGIKAPGVTINLNGDYYYLNISNGSYDLTNSNLIEAIKDCFSEDYNKPLMFITFQVHAPEKERASSPYDYKRYYIFDNYVTEPQYGGNSQPNVGSNYYVITETETQYRECFLIARKLSTGDIMFYSPWGAGGLGSTVNITASQAHSNYVSDLNTHFRVIHLLSEIPIDGRFWKAEGERVRNINLTKSLDRSLRFSKEGIEALISVPEEIIKGEIAREYNDPALSPMVLSSGILINIENNEDYNEILTNIQDLNETISQERNTLSSNNFVPKEGLIISNPDDENPIDSDIIDALNGNPGSYTEPLNIGYDWRNQRKYYYQKGRIGYIFKK